MSDRDLVVETVRDILEAHEPFALTHERQWDEALWADLAVAGLTGVGLPEGAGGSGGDFVDAVAVVRTLAAGAAAVPMAEQLLVAGPALLAAGIPLPPVDEPLTVTVARGVRADTSQDGRFQFHGGSVEIAWTGVARHVAVLVDGAPRRDGSVLALVDGTRIDGTRTTNLAGEPYGTIELEGVSAPGALLTEKRADEVRARFALARAVQLAAALEEVLAWTVQYAGEREQFGRPLGKFQAIQVELARMAGEVSATSALVDAAVQAVQDGDFLLAAAAAKARAGAAVEIVARLAHQVHGAIGFTQEFRLHHLTRRCWSWRDDAGSELAWERELASGLIADGADGLWPALTRVV